MALLFKKGTFAKATANGTQDVTGVGFQPTAYICWCASDSLTADGYAAHENLGMGYRGNLGRGCYFRSQDAVGTSSAVNGASGGSPAPVWIQATGILAQGAHNAFLADGFQLNWLNNASTSATLIHYIALGGGDLTNVAMINTTAMTGTGAKSVTGAGFQPDAVMFLLDGLGLGAAVSSTKRWATTWHAFSGATMSASMIAKRYQRTDSCFLEMNSSGVEIIRADFTSFDSDGYTLNVITNTSGFTPVALLLKTGGQVDVGSYTKATAANGVNTVTPSFANNALPVGGLLASFGLAATTAISNDSRISIGGFDASAAGCTWGQTTTAVIPTVAKSRFSSTKALSISTAPSTTNAECSAAISGADFTNTWTTNSGGTEQILWMAFGSAPQSMYPPFSYPQPQYAPLLAQ